MKQPTPTVRIENMHGDLVLSPDEAIIARPGDTLILAHPGRLSVQAVNYLRDSIEKSTGLAAIILEEGLTIAGISRPDPPTAEPDLTVPPAKPDRIDHA